MANAILTLNAGSSTVKYALFRDDEALTELARDTIEETGAAAMKQALEVVARAGATVTGVGHRVVHGGVSASAPQRIDAKLLEHLERLVPLAPLHQPHNLTGVRAAQTAFPAVPQIACFDTAFHRTHDFVEDVFALPRRYYDEGVRRFGFHGLSYEFIAGELERVAPAIARARVVVAHLGSGASMCALVGGRSVASTMGFSALDGLPMGTRSGSLDPGVLLHLLAQGATLKELEALLYKESGLKGLSGESNDMRALLASTSEPARQAVEYFVHRCAREVASLAAAARGLDALVFTAGIGERSAEIRRRVCERLDWLGVRLDARANEAGERVISAAGAPITVLVVPTNEERCIAQAVRRLAGA